MLGSLISPALGALEAVGAETLTASAAGVAAGGTSIGVGVAHGMMNSAEDL